MKIKSLTGLLVAGIIVNASSAWAIQANFTATASSQQAGFEASKLATGGTWKSGTSNLTETLTIRLSNAAVMPLFQFKLKQIFASYRFVGTMQSQGGVFETMRGSGNSTYNNNNLFTVTLSRAQSGQNFDPTVKDIAITITKQRASDAVELSGLILDILQNPWQNPVIRTDTNGDGAVGPIDALVVINYLNRIGSGTLPVTKPIGTAFVDVNGDGMVSPIDVLQVINHLNSR